jgi:hypothetical protein
MKGTRKREGGEEGRGGEEGGGEGKEGRGGGFSDFSVSRGDWRIGAGLGDGVHDASANLMCQKLWRQR